MLGTNDAHAGFNAYNFQQHLKWIVEGIPQVQRSNVFLVAPPTSTAARMPGRSAIGGIEVEMPAARRSGTASRWRSARERMAAARLSRARAPPRVEPFSFCEAGNASAEQLTEQRGDADPLARG